MVNLDELYLSHNGIEKIEGLDTLVSTECSAVTLSLGQVLP